MIMDHASFQEWMPSMERLGSMQYQQAETAFSGGSEEMEAASLAVIEVSVGDDRKCRHCGAAREQFREPSQEVCGGISAMPATGRSMRRLPPLCRVFIKKGSGLHTGPIFPRGLRSVIQPNAVTCLFYRTLLEASHSESANAGRAKSHRYHRS